MQNRQGEHFSLTHTPQRFGLSYPSSLTYMNHAHLQRYLSLPEFVLLASSEDGQGSKVALNTRNPSAIYPFESQ